MNKTDSEHKKLVSKIKSSNIILPIIIGLGVIGYMIYNEVNMELISQIHFGWKAALMIFIALLFMVGRDFGYMLRLRILCDKELSWLQTTSELGKPSCKPRLRIKSSRYQTRWRKRQSTG